jgi:tetratricopeptide (TPR) repeat protein
MMMGTPHYISPEQAKGLGDLDSGTDIYSLGVMMYELLVGDVPYQADTPFSVIHDHIYSPLPLPKDMNPDLTDDIQRALLKALAKKREDRFESMSEMMAVFLKAFETLIQEHPSAGEAPTLTLIAEQTRTKTDVAEPEEDREDTEILGVEPEVETRRKKGVPGWIFWMGIPAIVLLCMGTVVLRNALALPGPDLITSETLTQEAGNENGPVNQEIQTLLQGIRENPEDPFLRYTLGVAYLEANRPQLAREAFQKAYQLAEDNPQIILELGEGLIDINIWTYAAYSFLKVEQLGSPIPEEELQLKIREALFRAAFEDYSLEVLSRSDEIDLDPSLLRLVESRRALINGRLDIAERLVEQVIIDRPDLSEAYLLKSDVFFAQERFEEARDLLLELEQIENLPEWIVEELGLQPE